MKKTLLICVATFSFANIAYAAEAEIMSGTNDPVTQQPRNNHAGSANTTADQKPTKAKIDTSKQLRVEQVKQEGQENNDSLYDNIRSGWNKFIDLLAGPKQ